MKRRLPVFRSRDGVESDAEQSDAVIGKRDRSPLVRLVPIEASLRCPLTVCAPAFFHAQDTGDAIPGIWIGGYIDAQGGAAHQELVRTDL